MPQLNPDFEERDRLLFGRAVSWADELTGVKRFRGLGGSALRELVARNFADPEESQNGSATLGDFLKFLEKHPQVTAHGYAVSPKREDYRVSLEGLEYDGAVSADLQREFREMNGRAAEFACTPQRLFCWYD